MFLTYILLYMQGFCPYGYHNRMADILFKTGEGGLHALLHEPLGKSVVISATAPHVKINNAFVVYNGSHRVND